MESLEKTEGNLESCGFGDDMLKLDLVEFIGTGSEACVNIVTVTALSWKDRNKEGRKKNMQSTGTD